MKRTEYFLVNYRSCSVQLSRGERVELGMRHETCMHGSRASESAGTAALHIGLTVVARRLEPILIRYRS